MTSTSEVERNKAPSESACTTSALSPSTRHTARRRPTVVSGSYVTLSSNTRRTPPPAWVLCQAQPNGRGPHALPRARRPTGRVVATAAPHPGALAVRRPGRSPGRDPPAPAPPHRTPSSRHQGLAVLLYRRDLAVPAGHGIAQRPGRADHDLGTVLARHREQGLLAQAERFLRLIRLQPAPGQAERGQRPVQDFFGGVQPQGPGEGPLRMPVLRERNQRVALVEQELALGVPERAVAPFGPGQPGQRLMRAIEQAGGAPQPLRLGGATPPGRHP